VGSLFSDQGDDVETILPTAPAQSLAAAAPVLAGGFADVVGLYAGPTGGLSLGSDKGELEEAPLIGRRVGRYVVLSAIGKGGMGVVYSAYDEELDRRVAIKVLRTGRLSAASGRLRIQREAKALARLSHPNVVQVHDVGVVEGGLFIVMEFVRGEPLRSWQARHDRTSSEGRRAILEMYKQAGRGLGAAHAKGVIHRDFKPDNVLVGDDGRARVLDFGLAVGVLATVETEAREASVQPPLSGLLTETGTIMGTPGYMAPEQFRGEPSDQRTDVFAFAAALYEALCGEAPFIGETFAARQSAVLRGEVREPMDDLPGWIVAVLHRGLHCDPERRHASVEAMLVELDDDPEERRRRALWGIGVAFAMVLVSVGLIRAGEWLWESWRAERDEAQADARLVVAEARIDALVADGAEDEAERIFAAFIEHPDNRGRGAVGAAWLGRAGRSIVDGDTAAAMDAYAKGYAAAVDRSDQGAALTGLARIFGAEYRWRGFLLATEALSKLGHDTDGDPSLYELRLEAALANRDFRGAAEILKGPLVGTARAQLLPLVESLIPAMSTEYHQRGLAVVADVDGDGRPELIFENNTQERQLAQVVHAALGLPEMTRVDLGRGTFRALDPGAGEPALIVAREFRRVDGVELREAVLRRWQDGQFVELLRWPEGQIMSALGEDLDGDGVHELLIGTGPYTRRLLGLRRETDGSWALDHPAPFMDRWDSDIVELLAEDLNGDGQREVIAAFGPWFAYALHILRYDGEANVLVRVDHRRLGNITGVASIRRGLPKAADEIEVAVSKTDKYRNPEVFPVDRPLGEVSGTYLYRLGEEDALIETAFAPAPQLGDDAMIADLRPLAGDLDGDGREELIVGRSVADERGAEERDVTIIYRSDEGGGLVPVVIGGALPIAALDLDGDGDDELILSLTSDTLSGDVWVLGAGDEVPPPLGEELARARPVATTDPVVSRTWQRAEVLVQMGLLQQAAESLARAAELVAEPEGRSSALMRVGEIYELLGRDYEAGRAYIKAANTAEVPGTAKGAAARSFLRAGALEEAEESLGVEVPGVTEDSSLRGELRNLREGPSLAVDFGEPLREWWRVAQPLALRRDVARGALGVHGLQGELLSVPVDWRGGALSLEVELDIEQIEWNGGLQIGLLGDGSEADDGESPLAIEIFSGGGGGRHYYELRCVSYGESSSVFRHFSAETRAVQGGRFRFRAQLLPGLGEWTCSVDEEEGTLHRHDRRPIVRTSPTVPPQLRLRVDARGGGRSLAAVTLRGIELRGAGRVATAGASETRASRRLVDGDLRGALDLVRSTSPPIQEERLVEVAALAGLGRWPEAVTALRRLIGERAHGEVSLERDLRALLRSEPAVYGALLREAVGPSTAREHIYDLWIQPFEMWSGDRSMLSALWAGLAELEISALAKPELLDLRARVAERLGYLEVARVSYAAAIDAIERQSSSPITGVVKLSRTASQVRYDLAAIELAFGDEEAARRSLLPALGGVDPDPVLIDRVLAREGFEPLWDLAEAD